MRKPTVISVHVDHNLALAETALNTDQVAPRGLRGPATSHHAGTSKSDDNRGRLVQRYLNLLEASLTGMLFEDTRLLFGGKFGQEVGLPDQFLARGG